MISIIMEIEIDELGRFERTENVNNFSRNGRFQ
jgi:hypothetical protein